MTQQPPPYGSPQQPPQQPPYGVPSGYPVGHAPSPQKPRPSAGWFVVGIVLLLVAVAAGVGLFIWTLSGFLDTDAELAADGRPHQVSVGTDEDRMLWRADATAQECEVVDRRTGDVIALDPTTASFDRSDSGGSWHGFATFDPGSGDLRVTCSGGGTVLIGPAPHFGSFVVGIFATILVPLVLGLAGVVVLIVTGILWSTRPARPRA